MASDRVVSQELKSLRDELSAAQRERSAASASPQMPPFPSPQPVGGTADDDDDVRNQLGELVDAITGFLEEAEKDIAAHPARSVIGALVVGILIGRLMGRR